jgi:solute:Na+ symporter, SSS family
MVLSFLDWSIIGVYILFSLGVGVYFSKRASASTEEYFLSGRTLPWWVVGTSMVATTFAADTPLAITEFVRGPGIWQNWFWWNQLLAGLLGVFLFSRLWRRAEVLTDNELLELRYSGKPAAFLRMFKAGYFAILYNFIVMGWVINAMASVAAVMLNIDHWTAVWVSVFISLIYAMLSGFWGVVVTDLVQFSIAMFGSIALAVIAVSHFGGMDVVIERLTSLVGVKAELLQQADALKLQIASASDSLITGLPEKLAALEKTISTTPNITENTMSFIPPVPDAGFFTRAFWESPFSKFIVFLTMMWWSTHNTDGGGYIIQRMSSAKNEKHALMATLWFNLMNYAARVWPWVVVALVSLLMFPDLSGHELGEKAGYPLVMQTLLTSGMRGILVVSFLAAFMSTIDTHLNWGTSYMLNDIYIRFMRPEKSFSDKKTAQKHYIFVTRILTVVMMICAAFVATKMQSIGKAWEFVYAMGAGIGLVLILRWFWWRVNAWTEIAALSTSVVLTIIMETVSYFQTVAAGETYHLFNRAPQLLGMSLQIHHKLLIIVPISITVWLIVTYLTKPEDNERLKEFYARVHPGGWWGPVAKDLAVSASPVSRGFIGNWIAGVALVWGATFAIGNLLFGRIGMGLTLSAVAAFGYFWIYKYTISKLHD